MEYFALFSIFKSSNDPEHSTVLGAYSSVFDFKHRDKKKAGSKDGRVVPNGHAAAQNIIRDDGQLGGVSHQPPIRRIMSYR